MQNRIQYAAAGIWLMCVGVAHAQTVIDNPYANVSAAQAVFTPDVVRDLANQTRIRVLLSFRGDNWRLESARLEGGVRTSYPDKTGFVRVDLANADGESIATIGTPDPRIVRIYQPVPETGTWSEGDNPRHIFDPGKLRIRPPPAELRTPTIGPVPPLASQTVPEQPRARPQEGPPRFGTDAIHDTETLHRLLRARVAGSTPVSVPPPHIDVRVAEGRVVLFVANDARGCTVKVSVASAPSTPIQLTTPVLDFEGRPRCGGR